MMEIDGSEGEGGGQVLRSALTLSMITGRPFRLVRIRARRPKPGLLRQHLVAVQAAAQICAARTSPVALGAATLEFYPGAIRGGDYSFAIGSAGSSTLVLQTLLPALLYADAPSTVQITGGTHNPLAPPVHFLQRAYGRVLAQMGAQIGIEQLRFGFYPAGGGAVRASVQTCARLQPVELLQRGQRVSGYAEAVVAGVPGQVAQRELAVIGAGMRWTEEQLLCRSLPADQGPGNVLLLTLEHEQVTEVFAAFGERGLKAEAVGKRLLQEVRQYLATQAAVGPYLADQLLLPLALAGSGAFTASSISQHARTNADLIARFLPVTIRFEQHGHDDKRDALCTVKSSS